MLRTNSSPLELITRAVGYINANGALQSGASVVWLALHIDKFGYFVTMVFGRDDVHSLFYSTRLSATIKNCLCSKIRC